ncbi:MAG: hypothetical protein QM718_11965 [Steroidobacteraceae bacterium]
MNATASGGCNDRRSKAAWALIPIWQSLKYNHIFVKEDGEWKWSDEPTTIHDPYDPKGHYAGLPLPPKQYDSLG